MPETSRVRSRTTGKQDPTVAEEGAMTANGISAANIRRRRSTVLEVGGRTRTLGEAAVDIKLSVWPANDLESFLVVAAVRP